MKNFLFLFSFLLSNIFTPLCASFEESFSLEYDNTSATTCIISLKDIGKNTSQSLEKLLENSDYIKKLFETFDCIIFRNFPFDSVRPSETLLEALPIEQPMSWYSYFLPAYERGRFPHILQEDTPFTSSYYALHVTNINDKNNALSISSYETFSRFFQRNHHNLWTNLQYSSFILSSMHPYLPNVFTYTNPRCVPWSYMYETDNLQDFEDVFRAKGYEVSWNTTWKLSWAIISKRQTCLNYDQSQPRWITNVQNYLDSKLPESVSTASTVNNLLYKFSEGFQTVLTNTYEITPFSATDQYNQPIEESVKQKILDVFKNTTSYIPIRSGDIAVINNERAMTGYRIYDRNPKISITRNAK